MFQTAISRQVHDPLSRQQQGLWQILSAAAAVAHPLGGCRRGESIAALLVEDSCGTFVPMRCAPSAYTPN